MASPRPTSFPLTSTSSLPFPKSLRHNKSFVRLANLLGLGSEKPASGSFASGSGFGSGSGSGSRSNEGIHVYEDEEEEEGEEDGVEVDEESLMWDAQTALIAHQPSLAIQHYTLAALPPYRSSAACLALGNLLTRGSGLAPPAEPSTRDKGKGRAYSFGPTSPSSPTDQNISSSNMAATTPSAMGRIMGYIWPSSPPTETLGTTSPTSPTERTYTDLVATGWTIPKEGKRAVRDVEGMGVAGGWYVLGLGWIVDGQIAAGLEEIIQQESRHVPGSNIEEQDEGTVVFGSKSKEKIRRSPIIRPTDPGVDDTTIVESSSEDTILKTPIYEKHPARSSCNSDPEITLKLIYDLLQPLLRLYRNGHIQSSDPVYLPPISPTQLPGCLRPQGDLKKRRNVWFLGGRVVKRLLDLDIMETEREGSESRRVKMRRKGVEVMARYILAMTSSPAEAESHYRQIVDIGHSGLEYPDEIVRHAAKHLDIIQSPPTHTPKFRTGIDTSAYPFPNMTPSTIDLLSAPKRSFTSPCRITKSTISTSRRHVHQDSISSMKSSFSRIGHTSIKSIASVASLSEAREESVKGDMASDLGEHKAVDTLKRVQARSTVDLRESQVGEYEQGGWWPSISGWSYTKAQEKLSSANSTPTTPTISPLPTSGHPKETSTSNNKTTIAPTTSPEPQPQPRSDIPVIRTVASTPTLPSFPPIARPFDYHNSHSQINTTIDPALQAAELASTLTKKVSCGVCLAQGLNFPECRRCGLVFCSRGCRVGADKAGDGRRHLCGAWEGRRGLCVPPRIEGRRDSLRFGVAC